MYALASLLNLSIFILQSTDDTLPVQKIHERELSTTMFILRRCSRPVLSILQLCISRIAQMGHDSSVSIHRRVCNRKATVYRVMPATAGLAATVSSGDLISCFPYNLSRRGASFYSLFLTAQLVHARIVLPTQSMSVSLPSKRMADPLPCLLSQGLPISHLRFLLG